MIVSTKIAEVFGDKIRIRVCGILIQDDKMLLIRHSGIGKHDIFWSPPGGGLEFGENITTALIREFKEETGLEIRPTEFLGIHEHIEPPLHAVEFYFNVEQISGELKIGHDPELAENQIIQSISFKDIAEISSISLEKKHALLAKINDFSQFKALLNVF